MPPDTPDHAALPCPFCGESPEIVEEDEAARLVICNNADCAVGPVVDGPWALRDWNRRATPARAVPPGLIQRLQDAAAGARKFLTSNTFLTDMRRLNTQYSIELYEDAARALSARAVPTEAARNEILDVIVWLRNEADHEAFGGEFAHADELRRQADRLGCAVDFPHGGEPSEAEAAKVIRDALLAAQEWAQNAANNQVCDQTTDALAALDTVAFSRAAVSPYLEGQVYGKSGQPIHVGPPTSVATNTAAAHGSEEVRHPSEDEASPDAHDAPVAETPTVAHGGERAVEVTCPNCGTQIIDLMAAVANHLQCVKAHGGEREALERPKIVCLCGSTRFYQHFKEANFRETMAGRIVLSVGAYPHATASIAHGENVGITPGQKAMLDELHLRKIDLADEVLVLNVGGYIGESTTREIAYAQTHGKSVRYLEPRDALAHTQGEPDEG